MILCIVLSSCNATKFVPEGKYLLNKAQVKCVDDKTVPTSTLRNYLRQQQNTEILGFWKLQLDIYNTAPLDTTTKSNQRLARNAKKMGEAPVVYDPELTEISMQQLRQQKMELYARNGVELQSETEIDQEIVAEYVERIFTEHFEGGQISMKAERTLAVQIPAELFERLKDYLAAHNLKQKQFLVQLIENALDETEAE